MAAMAVVAVLVPLAWLLGTFPTAVLVARAHGHDITKEGSGNPGASNVTRLLGFRAGLMVFTGDFLKGAISGGAGYAVAGRPGAFVLGLAAVLGHTFPIYRKGGRGVAAAGGVLVVLYPLIALGLAIVWIVVARLLHKASLASLLVSLMFPIAVVLTGHEVWEDIVVSALGALIIVRHAANIRRLIRHQENDLDTRRQS
jgi:glycerol-3-phosphate acyltransferase PlsY